MLNYTQLILMVSTIAEYNQKRDTDNPMQAFDLLKSLGKAMTHADVLGTGAAPDASVAKHPIAAIGQVVEQLTKTRVNTWDNDEPDMLSLAKVVNAISEIDPNDSSVDSEANGRKVLDALPPMVKATIDNVLDLADSFGSQVATDDQTEEPQVGRPLMERLPLDTETRLINKDTIAEINSQRHLI